MDKKKHDLKKSLPSWVTVESVERVLSHYKDGEFVFDLPEEEICETVRGTTYHVIPHFADEGAEEITQKLRRIMANELPKD